MTRSTANASLPEIPGTGRIRTVHLVYPHGTSRSTPDAIGRNLGRRLEERYRVEYHEWAARDRITPEADAALVGHPHPAPGTVFRRSAAAKGWGRVLMLAPFTGVPDQSGFEDGVIRRCDLFLAITGPYWFSRAARSPVRHWTPKLRRLDLAVDDGDFPPIKQGFGPPGRRRFVYIGHASRYKNTAYLEAIARRLPDTEFGWIGHDRTPIRGFVPLGWQDFSQPAARSLVASYDFLITVGRADANPTTILEAMAWGLIPVCTPQSGYDRNPGIVNVPLDDVDGVATVIARLQALTDSELREMQQANWATIRRDYTWDRFAAAVVDAIESQDSPALLPEPAIRRWQLWLAGLTSPHTSPFVPLRAQAGGRLRALARAAKRRKA